jgi:hypothetical protein
MQTRKGTSACSSHPLSTHPRLETRASACWPAAATLGAWHRLGCRTVDAAYDQGSGGGSTFRPRVHNDVYNVSVHQSIAREPRGRRSQGLRATGATTLATVHDLFCELVFKNQKLPKTSTK